MTDLKEEDEAVRLIVSASRLQDMLRADLEENVVPRVNYEVTRLIVPQLKQAGKLTTMVVKALKMVPPDVWARIGQELGNIISNLIEEKMGGGARTASRTKGFRRKAEVSLLRALPYVEDRLFDEEFTNSEKLAKTLIRATYTALRDLGTEKLLELTPRIQEHYDDLKLYEKVLS